MASRWTDIDTEVEGVEKAARNLCGDNQQLAAYVYERCAAYTGGHHDRAATALIARALDTAVTECTQEGGRHLILRVEAEKERDTLRTALAGAEAELGKWRTIDAASARVVRCPYDCGEAYGGIETMNTLRETWVAHFARCPKNPLVADLNLAHAAGAQLRQLLEGAYTRLTAIFDVFAFTVRKTLDAPDSTTAWLAAHEAELVERCAKVADRWAHSHDCKQHDADPCCHVRTGVGIAAAIRARTKGAG